MSDHIKTNIRENENSINNVHANYIAVVDSREEFNLLFGTEQKNTPDVRLTNRIILSPYSAKQLSFILERVISDYEKDFGILPEKEPSSTAEERKLKASSLFQLVKELDISIGYEQSFKILENSLLSNRFLLGISTREIDCQAQDRIVSICERMAMPRRLQEIFRECLSNANYVHFGFEDNRISCMYKVYVEFWDGIEEEFTNSRNNSKPHLLHLGFKWDPFDPEKNNITRYTWHPWLTGEEILNRIGAIADPVKHGHLFETAENVVKISTERMSYRDILYLEVTEEGNPRKSFDINVYRGGLLVGELYPLLTRLGQHYAIPHAEFHGLYDDIKTKRFGHLSGGINREGKDFCTVYYGVESPGANQTGSSKFPGNHPPPVSDRVLSEQSQNAQPIEKTDEQAAILVDLVKKLQVPFGFERSFKIAHKTFLPERFLVGFERKKADGGQPARIMDICRRINMPEDFLMRFQEDYAAANIILFGFERNEKSRFYKVYLEFTDRHQKAVEKYPENPDPFEIFTGFKWNISDPSRKVVTRYTCFPSYVLNDMMRQASRFLYRNAEKKPERIVNGILEMASYKAAPNEFQYFEAGEADNQRKSFSINLYWAGLRMMEIYPFLLEMAHYYSVPTGDFLRVYDAVKTQILGNLAGGIDREGRDFLTLYFSEKGSTRNIGIRPRSDERMSR
jgi:hypothetical protein